MKKKKILVYLLTIICILAILGGSYAYLRVEKESGNQKIDLVTKFDVILSKDINELNLTNQVPLSDEEGVKGESRSFQIKNEGAILAEYKVSLIDNELSTLPNKDVRYKLKKTKSSTNIPEELEIKSLSEDGLIDSGTIGPNETIDYEIICWIDYNVTEGGLSFSKKVLVEGTQPLSLDKSGANPPEMLKNMIPVYYDETSKVWRVADATNRNETYKWYDYDKYMWANAVTIKETSGTLNADKSMSFNGTANNYLDLGHEDTKFDNTITMAFRLKVNNYKDLHHEALKKPDSSYLGIRRTDTSDFKNNFYFSLYIDGTNWHHLNANFAPNLNEWYTVVGTYDGETQKIYVNGELKASTKFEYTIKNNTNTFIVGKESNVTVSDAFVYTDALTDEEVAKYFSGDITDYPKDNLIVAKTEFNELDARQKYLEATPGTEVKMDDISSMWVWVPRYKYTIFNGNNGTSNEQMINVKFEHGIDKTGTVSCHDVILTDDDSSSSEECTDTTNGSIINGKSTYTHPAFTFGSEELVGFWFAKFETSTDDSECLENQSTSCNKAGMNILIKPNQVSLRYQEISNLFANFRNMETYGNIHGFPQNEKATNYLDASGNLSGDIVNDDNNYDIHMMKNMDWGAVAYLTMSKYGKYGNPLYVGANKEVYMNSYTENVDEVYTLKTGYSSKGVKAIPGTSGVLYNDMTIEKSGEGYIGAGASTTGTIYGIYDMAGGYNEWVMANAVDKNGNFNNGVSILWKNNNQPLEKYYDKYSYANIIGNDPNGSDISKNAITRGKLGDATKEIMKQFEIGDGTWYNDYSHAIVYYYCRGGSSPYNKDSEGMFFFYNAGVVSGYRAGSRPVLAISRELPWLNN